MSVATAPASPDLPGRLVAVEGLDGSGKSTQVHLLHQWLLGLGCKVFFSEWNSSLLVKGATKKGKKRMLLTPTTFSLIHATDFADRYERQILPMLKAGYIVLCDRYMFTAFARDRVRGCDATWLRRLYGYARVPDVTFYFRLPLETAHWKPHSEALDRAIFSFKAQPIGAGFEALDRANFSFNAQPIGAGLA